MSDYVVQGTNFYPRIGGSFSVKFVQERMWHDIFPPSMAREVASILESDNFDGVFSHYIAALNELAAHAEAQGA